MDGITFGVIYSLASVLPFDLKLLSTQQYSTPAFGTGITDTWWLSEPGRVEHRKHTLKEDFFQVFHVDSEGRIIDKGDRQRNGAVTGIKEFTYTNGMPTRILSKVDSGQASEETLAWSEGKLMSYVWKYVDGKDSSVWTYVWKQDRIDSLKIIAFGEIKVSTIHKYTYPVDDSIHMTRVSASDPGEFGFKLKDGHVVRMDHHSPTNPGNIVTMDFNFGMGTGLSPAMPYSSSRKSRAGEFRDWLGRAKVWRQRR